MVSRHTVAVLTLAVLCVLAGCGQRSPDIDTDVGVVDRVDTDCDGQFSQLTLDVAVTFGYVPDGFFSPEPFLLVTYATGDGGTNRYLKVDTVGASGVDRTLTVRVDDIDGVDPGQETRFNAELRSPGLLSSDVIRSDSTEWVAVEPASADRPKVEAGFEYTPSKPRPNQSVRLSGFDAASGGCEIAAYRWDLDADGETDQRGRTVTHRFRTDGYHDVVLNVTTSRGVTNSVTREVFIFYDPDGDGITSAIERERGTDPRDADTDDDLFPDGVDPAPTTLLVPTSVIHIFLTATLYLGGVRYRDRIRVGLMDQVDRLPTRSDQIRVWVTDHIDRMGARSGRIRSQIRDRLDRVRQWVEQLR